MSNTFNSLEEIKFINDWGKWLVTIETAAITIIGALFTANRSVPGLAKMFGTLAMNLDKSHHPDSGEFILSETSIPQTSRWIQDK